MTNLEKAETFDPKWTDPQILCSQKGASVEGSLGPFGLLVMASKSLEEHTAVFFRVFKGQNKYVVLMCSDQSRSECQLIIMVISPFLFSNTIFPKQIFAR